MENGTEILIGNGLDEFINEIKATITKQGEDDYIKIFKEDKISYLEDRLYDQIIVYMGDKETDRIGKNKDVMDIAILAFLIWLRKHS